MKFFEHINDRGNKVILQALEQPQTEFGSPVEVFETTLKHEQHMYRQDQPALQDRP